MKKRYIFIAIVAIFGYNYFLIQRDQQMFNTYYGKETPKEQYCKQQTQWHPDCNVE